MQNWRDEIQLPYPGYRDRIVQISQLGDEGRLNLDMREEHIETLNGAGLAADRFVARFPPDFAEKEKGEKTTRRSVRAHSSACWRPGTWHDVIARLHDSKTYSSKEADLAIDCLGRLRDLGKAISDSGASMEKDTPRPRATMRIAPRL